MATPTLAPIPPAVSPLERAFAERMDWLVRLRWLTAAGVVVVSLLAGPLFGFGIATTELVLTGVAIGAFNGLFRLRLRQVGRHPGSRLDALVRAARLQFAVDWITVTVLVHYSGGIESPILVCYMFLAVAVSVLPEPRAAAGHALGGVVCVWTMALAEHVGLLPHYPVAEFANPHSGNLSFLFGTLAILTVGIYTSALVASLVSRQVIRTARLMDRVEEAWRRTRTLNEINAAVNASLDLPAVMDTAVRLAAEVMGARACSVHLLGEEDRALRSCAATGMDPGGEEADACGDPCPSLDARARSGEVVRVEDLAREPASAERDGLLRRGFGAAVVAPLDTPTGPVGILHLFWARPRRFTGEETEFLRALAAECTTAIVNARAYRNLQELEQEKSRFVFKVAHEIKAPVAAMDTHLMFLLEGYAGPLEGKQRTAIDRASRRLSALQALIRDLLAMGAIRGRLPDQPRVERDLVTAVRDELERVREEADRKGIVLDVTVPDAPVPYATCNDDLERVLGNLIGNAVKYTPASGRVRVALEALPGEVTLVVADTGIGIPDEAREHLFEEFYRAPNARLSGIEGTGLGLSLVRRIVEFYRGRIDVESAPGQGTTFTVRLPIR